MCSAHSILPLVVERFESSAPPPQLRAGKDRGPKLVEVAVACACLRACSTSLSIGHLRSQWCVHRAQYTNQPLECPKTTLMFHQDILHASANEGTSTQGIQRASDSASTRSGNQVRIFPAVLPSEAIYTWNTCKLPTADGLSTNFLESSSEGSSANSLMHSGYT